MFDDDRDGFVACKEIRPCQKHEDTPTLTEQKGEWEEFSDYFERVFASCDTDCADKSFHAKQLFTFIAAKKKQWEAQKEQAVKAEIERLREIYYPVSPERKEKETLTNLSIRKAVSHILSLLSDKVNH